MAFEASTPQAVRNVVVVGHTGAGKTTVVEALLAGAGAIPRAGSVVAGTTVTDFDDQARAQGRSVGLAVASCEVAGVKVNLVDTPGHPDYVGELRAGLRAADGALFVLSAVDGLDGATALLWEECAALGMPRAVLVTQLDHPRADFDESVAVCQRVFGEGVVPLYLPLHDGAPAGSPAAGHPLDGGPGGPGGLTLLGLPTGRPERVVGLLGLLSLQVFDHSGPVRQVRDADPEHVELVQGRRADLVEAIIQESEDDALMDRYLADQPVDLDLLVPDLERAVARGAFYPVLPMVAPDGLGVAELLELLVRGFPSPVDREVPAVSTPDGDPRGPLACDPTGPLVAEVVKTTSDPYVGRVSVLRVFSGTLRPDSQVQVSGHRARFVGGPVEHHEDHDVLEQVGLLASPLGAVLRPTGRCIAGDVCAVARLKHAETGDTVSDVGTPLLMQPWVMPEPLLPVAVRAASPSDDEKLAEALARLTAEDATVRVDHDASTQQLVLWTMGETHVGLVLARLRGRYGVQVGAVPVRVSLRETFAVAGSGQGRLVRQSGGHGQFAVCDLEVVPLPAGSGVVFVDRVVGGAVPGRYVAGVERGVRARADRGLLAGFPLTDVQVTLVGGQAHPVDSSDAAFATAGGLALEDAARVGLRLLEPVDTVQVTVDHEFVGAVMTDLAGRRGRVTGTEPLGTGRSTVLADVPASSLARYAVDLRSVAHGTGTFTRRYAQHEPVPTGIQDTLLAAAGAGRR